MTTVLATTAASSYVYGKSSGSASQDIPACSTATTKKSNTGGQFDNDTSSSADRLMAQLMTLAMNRFDQSGHSSEQDGDPGMDISELDADGDGYVSKTEFVAGRPSDVSEDQAATLFDSFDSESTGSLSVDALTQAMSAQQSGGPGKPQPATDDQFASLLSDLDTNGDGLVSLDEFMAGKPDDVTESEASRLFALLDTSGTGSVSERSAS